MLKPELSLTKKTKQNRQFVWQMVRNRLNFLISEIMREQGQLKNDEKYEMTNEEMRAFAGAYIPLAEICDLCKYKPTCEIRARMKEANAKIHATLEQVYGNQVQIGTVFSIYQCGIFEFVNLDKMVRDIKRKIPTAEEVEKAVKGIDVKKREAVFSTEE